MVTQYDTVKKKNKTSAPCRAEKYRKHHKTSRNQARRDIHLQKHAKTRGIQGVCVQNLSRLHPSALCEQFSSVRRNSSQLPPLIPQPQTVIPGMYVPLRGERTRLIGRIVPLACLMHVPSTRSLSSDVQ